MTPPTDSPTLDRDLAYAVFRLTLGVNILVHGAGRIFGPGAEAFATTTAAEFTKTALPMGLVQAFLIVLPFAELALGALTTLGLDPGRTDDHSFGFRHCHAERLEHGGRADDLRDHLLSAADESRRQSFLGRRARNGASMIEGRRTCPAGSALKPAMTTIPAARL